MAEFINPHLETGHPRKACLVCFYSPFWSQCSLINISWLIKADDDLAPLQSPLQLKALCA